MVRIFPYPVKHHAAPDWGAGSRSGQRLESGAHVAHARNSAIPDVPTMAEAGFPGFEDDSWVGLWVHVGTPTAVITRLREEMARIAGLPDTRERLRQIQPGQFELRLNHQVNMTDLCPQYPAMGEAFMVDGDGRLCSRMSLG